MNSSDDFRAEVIRQLEGDILSFGWLRQMAEMEFGHSVGGASRKVVFDLACALVDLGVAVVGDAKNDGKMVLVYPWRERGEALKERMSRKVDSVSPQDQNCAFWLQLLAHQKEPNQSSQPTPLTRRG